MYIYVYIYNKRQYLKQYTFYFNHPPSFSENVLFYVIVINVLFSVLEVLILGFSYLLKSSEAQTQLNLVFSKLTVCSAVSALCRPMSPGKILLPAPHGHFSLALRSSAHSNLCLF